MHISAISRRSAAVCFALAASAGCAAEDAGLSALSPRWEVTVGANGKHNGKGWRFAVPETKIEYRWSKRLTVVSKNSWVIVAPDHGTARRGLGAAKLGFKWRLWDDPAHDFSFALYPQMARFISRSSVRRGVTSEEKEFALATETTFTAAGLEFEVQAGRNFVGHEADEWTLEIEVAGQCLPHGECILTVDRDFVPSELQRTLVKAGIDWKINEILTLKSALGRELGPRGAGRKDLTASLGLKFRF